MTKTEPPIDYDLINKICELPKVLHEGMYQWECKAVLDTIKAHMGDASTSTKEGVTSPAQTCEISDIKAALLEYFSDSNYPESQANGAFVAISPYLRTSKPVSSNLQQERDFLFDLAVSTDANRICDRNEKINFEEQLVRSKDHVKYLLKGMK